MIALELAPTSIVAGAAVPAVVRMHNTWSATCREVKVDLRPSDHLSVVQGARRFAVPSLVGGENHDHPVVLSCATSGRHVLRVHRLEYVGPDGRLRRESGELALDVAPAPPPPARPPRARRRGSIFLSYRRADTGPTVALLAAALESAFPGRVFHDLTSLVGGDDWQVRIDHELGDSGVLVLAVIGPRWLTLRDERGMRSLIEREDDVLRREIATALTRGSTVIPVLADDAEPLHPDQLPGPLKPLCRRQFHRMPSDRGGIEGVVTLVRHQLGE